MSDLATVVVALGALALVVEKTVSFIRRATGSPGPTWVWNVVAMVVGVAYCVGWQINLAPGVLAAIPATHASTALSGTSGEVLSGLVAGAAAGFAYGVLQALEATVHRNRANAPPPSGGA